jgi:CRISPR-associated protein Csd2
MGGNNMSTLTNKIDFAVVVSVKHANPNGDPLNGNRPRTNYDGIGEISDVCLKRKIRDRLMEVKDGDKLKYNIFVQSDDNKLDNCKNLRERAEKELGTEMNNPEELRKKACEKWIDVRTFGQVFPFKSKKGKDKPEGSEEASNAVSVGIRGPVSIHPAFSVLPVMDKITSNQLIKCTSLEGDGIKRQPDQMGMKHRVDHGLYVFYGSMNPQLATKTGFNDEDADAIKKALINLFENDESSARPAGSMEVVKVFWWKHNCQTGQYSSAKVHRTLDVKPKQDIQDPKSISDYYDIKTNDLEGLKPAILES